MIRPKSGRSKHHRSLRTRLTVIASLAVTAAVSAGIVLLYLLQMQSVRGTVDAQLHNYAAQITQSADTGTWPQPLPSSQTNDAAWAQIVAPDGTVLAATADMTGWPAAYTLPADASTPLRLPGAGGAAKDSEQQVAAIDATINGQQVTVVTGTAIRLLTSLTSSFETHLFLGFPVIMALAAAAVWFLVGRALRPVELIRRTAADITAADLSQRVPEPGTEDEVGRLAQTMNQMLDRIESATARQRRFVADASHELRSPLAALRTTLEVGLAHPERAPWQELAGRASAQGSRLEDLIQQLLLLAKADEHTLTQHRKPVDVPALVRDVIDALPPHERRIDLDTPAAVTVLGNPDHLARMLRNVLDNAVRYAHSRVLVAVLTDQQDVEILVTDNGPGVPEADRERVFDRFVRLDPSRDRTSGNSGLGLAIAREIAAAHHGSIRLAPATTGALVIMRLPAGP
jgi:signal transduction histidine kinase